MTTAVQSPPGFQSLSRLGWNAGSTNPGGYSAMSSDEPGRMFMPPQRKAVTRSTSSSSLASNSSTNSAATVTSVELPSGPQTAGEISNTGVKKKPRGGFWPVSKAESTSGITNTRVNGAVQPPNMNGTNGLTSKGPLQPAIPSQNHVNGGRATNGPVSGMEAPTAILALLPLNGTFERKQINVPPYPDILKIGRQTNAKTVPTPVNGYFDSKVLSRQHAEIWSDRGKIMIRDVKSSNGTFVNGHRLSPENKESEPQELRQGDTLELGIDIVSEDQKTIVHHKVSAKVEFAGLPGISNNVLDLSFGDLDPSHGGPLLATPMSQPMVQSRSRPGGPVNGRISAASSVVGAHMTSAVQQRQNNYWGTPLNIEQLVKHLSTEMRAAKQQAQDLDHAHSFLNSMIAPDGSPSKLQAPVGDPSAHRQPNGRTKAQRMDHAARFSDPPAPPPQQPLPEKPDSAKSSPINTAPLSGFLKRSDTAKPPANGVSQSPPAAQSGQIMSLVSALEVAKKELDSQNSRIKHLEDTLKQERTAREAAEERARRVEEVAAARPVPEVETDESSTSTDASLATTTTDGSSNTSSADEELLQQRLDNMVAEMQLMKNEMDQANKRADTAERDAAKARISLAEMIERLKQENASTTDVEENIVRDSENAQSESTGSIDGEDGAVVHVKHGTAGTPSMNGHVRAPSRLPQAVETMVATVLRENRQSGDFTAQSAPYVSMVGVVLIGVGVMAYLNSWQKGDK